MSETIDVKAMLELPPADARKEYLRLKQIDNAAASALHQAYYEAHKVRLTDKVAAAAVAERSPERAEAPWSAGAPDRSNMKRWGIIFLLGGIVFAIGAAGIEASPLTIAFFGAVASMGVTLWIAGAIEERLIEIRQAIEARATS